MSVVVLFNEKSDLVFLSHWAQVFSKTLNKRIAFYFVTKKQTEMRDIDLSEDELLPLEFLEVFRKVPSEEKLEPQFKVVSQNEIQHTQALNACLSKEKAELLLLASNKSNHGFVQLLYEKCAKSVVLLRESKTAENKTVQKILVPTAGGANAQFALHLMSKLAKYNEGLLVPAYVEQNFGEYAQGVGDRHLKSYLKKAGIDANDEHIESKVLVSSDIKNAILQEIGDDYDLVLVGGSHRGFVHRTLHNTLPYDLMESDKAITVGVAKNAEPLTSLWRKGIENWFDVTVPQLNRDDRISLFEKIEGGSYWTFDFMALITLATAIAALGLLQNSGAVVIGAMLVAPLMTPILGVGLALVHGKLPLLRASLKSITLGFLLALFVSFVAGAVVNIPSLNEQLLARCSPTIIDLMIALLSGLAAAHCMARPNLSAALPGVAIAAALVPPIATVGISFALGEVANGLGAALLFATNVAAIILGASLSFYSAGLRGAIELKAGKRIIARVYLLLIFLVLVFMVPLGKKYLDDFIKQSERFAEKNKITAILNEMLYDNVQIKNVTNKNISELEIEIVSNVLLDKTYVVEVKKHLKKKLGKNYKITVNYSLQIVE